MGIGGRARSRVRGLAALTVALLVAVSSLSTLPAAADETSCDSEAQESECEHASAAAPTEPILPLLPITRNLVCPVLYTHEDPTQDSFRGFITGQLAACYRPT